MKLFSKIKNTFSQIVVEYRKWKLDKILNNFDKFNDEMVTEYLELCSKLF